MKKSIMYSTAKLVNDVKLEEQQTTNFTTHLCRMQRKKIVHDCNNCHNFYIWPDNLYDNNTWSVSMTASRRIEIQFDQVSNVTRFHDSTVSQVVTSALTCSR